MWDFSQSAVTFDNPAYLWDGSYSEQRPLLPLGANMITQAIQSILKADVKLRDVAAIERSPLLNEDPSKSPWIGIYRSNSVFKPRTLGYGPAARYQSTEVVLVVQVANAQDGEACEDEIEDYLSEVLLAIFSNPTLNGLVSTITISRIMYRMVQVQEDDFFQQAEIYLTAETTTR